MTRSFLPALGVFLLSAAAARADDLGSRTGTMWAPYLEWSLNNASHSGNAYDVLATVTFTHGASGETRTTQMFHDGSQTWKFRFTGTKTGAWSFTTSSGDPDLNGHTGTVTINPNPDPDVRGFLTHDGNRYVIQTGDAATPRAYLHTVYMNGVNFDSHVGTFGPDAASTGTKTAAFLGEALDNGFETIFVTVNNSWFKYGTKKYTEHSSTQPDPVTFRVLETIITTVHAAGGRVHLWCWGDESRQWTPIGVGGINGTADRRVQRYIAARLGPLPGWTMGYGFDLHEWTTPAQLDSWAQYLHDRFGWQHLVCTRGEPLTGPNNMNSYDGFGRGVTLATTSGGPQNYQEIVDDLNGDLTRPHFYEERHSYLRSGFNLDMDGTRRLLWWQAMAGGMGGFFGFYSSSPHPYPHPEQLRTHYEFWHVRNRFRLGMQRANVLTDGYALRENGNARYVFYRENASSIQADLSGMSGPQPAVAVDLKQAYAEIDLGVLSASSQTLTLPHSSDWAIAVGSYSGTAPPPPPPPPPSSPPAAPSGLAATAVSPTRIDLAWNDNSGDESGFIVERSADGGATWSVLDSVAADVTTYADTGVAPGATLHYRVKATNGSGDSAPSNIASATAPSFAGDLILHWMLDDGAGTVASDSSGNGYDGSVNGGTWGGGLLGGALQFAGSGDEAVDADAGLFLNGLGAVTVALWVKSDLTGTDRGVVLGEEPSGSDHTLAIRYDAAGASGGGSSLVKAALTTTGGVLQVESASNVQTTDWQHLALTWTSGGGLTLYVDGVATIPTSAGGTAAGTLTGITRFVVGKGAKDGPTTSWDGLVDDVRIYSRALTAPEVLDLYGSGSGGDTDGDGLPDDWEMDNFGSLSPTPGGDPDADGLTNQEEWSSGTDPNAADTDGDGLTDAQETGSIGTSPLAPDTDGDGVGDGAEVAAGTDPLDPASPPAGGAPAPAATTRTVPVVTGEGEEGCGATGIEVLFVLMGLAPFRRRPR